MKIFWKSKMDCFRVEDLNQITLLSGIQILGNESINPSATQSDSTSSFNLGTAISKQLKMSKN